MRWAREAEWLGQVFGSVPKVTLGQCLKSLKQLRPLWKVESGAKGSIINSTDSPFCCLKVERPQANQRVLCMYTYAVPVHAWINAHSNCGEWFYIMPF